MLFESIRNSSAGMVEVLEKQSQVPNQVDIKDVVARYITDVICSYAFGVECNSVKNPQRTIRKNVRSIFEISRLEKIRILLLLILPTFVLKLIRLKQFSLQLEEFFITVVNKTVSHRETNIIRRQDFIQLLLDMKNKKDARDKNRDMYASETGNTLTLTEITAHCFVFFLAGYETSATAITFALLELAINKGIQERLRDEINAVLEKHNGDISYDAVMEMTYLEKIIFGNCLFVSLKKIRLLALISEL